MCTGCREMKPKKELLRVVRPADEEKAVHVDRTGKAAGRGAYICADVACLKKAQKTKALERALEKAITPEVYEQLEREIARRDM
jgi:predicted RNA-binding protein YlxR (DUF448 family)